MILQALTEYYHRKKDQLARIGFEEKEIPFLIVIAKDGRFVQLTDTRDRGEGDKLRAQMFIVPQGKGRSGGKSYETAYPLWDHFGYVIGQPKVDRPDSEPSEKDALMASRQHVAFIRKVEQIHDEIPDDRGVSAVLKFLSNESEKEKVRASSEWQEVLKIKGCNLSFKLADEPFLICQSPAVQQWVASSLEGEAKMGICLVTGEKRPVARLHSVVKGVWGAQVAGASFVSFNFDAFESRNRSQGDNSPVSEQAVFEYSTALNYLLRTDCPSRFQMGETSVVCWSQQQSDLETAVPLLFSDAPKDDPDRDAKTVKALYDSLHSGAYSTPDSQQPFYVLGLAPNASRIAVRFWHSGTVAEFAERLGQWINDTEIVKPGEREYPSVKALLRSTALLGKDENMPPHLVGETVRAVLSGLPLPASALQAVIKRIKAEKGSVSFYRAALIKACLNRQARSNRQPEKELSVSHNPSEKRIGYRLGSLFAVLEKLQQDANPGLNATIRDRYYSSASCTPRSVFGTLMRLHTHHLKKLENPSWRNAAQRRISDIISDIGEFPAQLNLEDQGLFAIGYYHQRQALYTKKETIVAEGETA
ncbi:MAG: CRISPR-associated protein Cas8c/Csd1, subtype I-C/DVULG [Marinobacter excellens HL-55]|uniref:CRISPR-associated protein Cas8c/Csd1, subtype I-C/DVULG n=1 Tax=Marinobacter excellens HL-55 TaxID=1305731 RepID=A0A0P7Z350_9GAMM|nr:MAG: CRISPR-associated protein Cas8c/Csd1, subtype I-C/DVULG [Marinobacter excellens HL-55]